jgi:hypothetical protein
MAARIKQLPIITSRLDAHAADNRQLMQRDALRDHLAPIVVDQPLLSPRLPHAPPLFPHGPSIHPTVSAPLGRPAALEGRRPTIDPLVVGREASEAADTHGLHQQVHENKCSTDGSKHIGLPLEEPVSRLFVA